MSNRRQSPYRIKMLEHIREHLIRLMEDPQYLEPEPGCLLSCYVDAQGCWRFSPTGLLCEAAIADGVKIKIGRGFDGLIRDAMTYDDLSLACPDLVSEWAGCDPNDIDSLPAEFSKAIAKLRERK